MNRIPVAHLREQGQNMVIVPMDRSFAYKSLDEQNEIRATLQVAAKSADLAGTVVPVWDAGGGRMGFIAPSQWRSFFSGLSLRIVARNINREIVWS
jgi:hypothetical protein